MKSFRARGAPPVAAALACLALGACASGPVAPATSSTVACPGGAPFSWDRVQKLAFVATSNRDYTPEEGRFLVENYELITVGNAHAISVHGGAEASSIAAARQLKAIKPDAKVLFYWNSFIAYTFHTATMGSKPDSWHLRDPTGALYKPGANPWPRWDLSNPDVRRWWTDVAVQTLASGDLDGVFVDAVPQVAGRPDEMRRVLGEEKAVAVNDGLRSMLADLQRRLGPDKIVIYNGPRDIPGGWSDGGLSFLDVTSAAYIEHFDFRESGALDRLAADIELMIEANRRGKIVVLKGWPGFSWLDPASMKLSQGELQTRAREAIHFPLAAYLIGAGPCSYFAYSWGYREGHGAFTSYAEFERRLGPPKASATRKGYAYRREYEGASVELDLASKTGRIVWRRSAPVRSRR